MAEEMAEEMASAGDDGPSLLDGQQERPGENARNEVAENATCQTAGGAWGWQPRSDGWPAARPTSLDLAREPRRNEPRRVWPRCGRRRMRTSAAVDDRGGRETKRSRRPDLTQSENLCQERAVDSGFIRRIAARAKVASYCVTLSGRRDALACREDTQPARPTV